MERNPSKGICWAPLLVLLCLVVLLGIDLRNQQQEKWRQKHDGLLAPYPSPIPYPRMDPAERQALFLELLQSNGDCQFPCWWGIVPGETPWEETHAFLSPFMETNTQRYIDDDGRIFTRPSYYYENSVVGIEETVREDGRVASILIDYIPLKYVSNFKMSSMFQRYGLPDEIFIRSPHSDGSGNCEGEFELFLYYPAKQFAVRYHYLWYPLDQPIQVCGLDQPDLAEFYLWDPALDYASIEEAIKLTDWYPREKIVPIEQATSWTRASFYQALQSQEGASFCIEAPAYDWSGDIRAPKGKSPYWFCRERMPTELK